MMQRILSSKNLLAFVLATATGMTLYFRVPFPEGNTFLLIMALRSLSAFEVPKYSYTLLLFSTPYIGYSVVLSGLYIFSLKAKRRIRAGRLPLSPAPRKRDDLFLVVGEVHNPRKQVPSESPYNIASLLNNLFGRGKEPFWQQAYTSLMKFIILLHDNPDEVIRLIADYRGDDKLGPESYARRTVNKAQAELTNETWNPATYGVYKSPPIDKEPDY